MFCSILCGAEASQYCPICPQFLLPLKCIFSSRHKLQKRKIWFQQVIENCRGQGIGNKLLDGVINIARGTNCRKLRWQVSKWNNQSSILLKTTRQLLMMLRPIATWFCILNNSLPVTNKFKILPLSHLTINFPILKEQQPGPAP